MNFTRITTRSLSIMSAVVAVLAAAPAWAVSASLYVSPASGTVSVGSIIPVEVRVNSGTDPVNAVQANITYNAAQLSYQGVQAAGSAFGLDAHSQTAAGSLSLVRATNGGDAPVKGDNLFVTVLFKAVTTTGTASVAIASGSHVVRSTDSVDIIAGAAAASGPKLPTAGAPTPKAYATLAQAQASVAASATPKPSVTVAPAAAMSETPNNKAAAAATTDAKVAAWKSPLVLGGGVVAVLLIAFGVASALRRRHGVAAVPADSQHTNGGMPQTIFHPTEPTSTVQPSHDGTDSESSDKIEG